MADVGMRHRPVGSLMAPLMIPFWHHLRTDAPEMVPGNLLMNSETRIQSLVWSVVSGLELGMLIVKLLHRKTTDIKGMFKPKWNEMCFGRI